MPERNNALCEIARFWLETRHNCLVQSSLPVKVTGGNSDIDMVAIKADGKKLVLPDGTKLRPRFIVETKDEHDHDRTGAQFTRYFRYDLKSMGSGKTIRNFTKKRNKFTMLRYEHYIVAQQFFNYKNFDRLFIVHELNKNSRDEIAYKFRQKDIYLLTVHDILDDIVDWYDNLDKPTVLRNTMTGDMIHLLFGYYLHRRNA